MEQNPKRILITISSRRWGGGERHVWDLLRILQVSGLHPVLLCPHGPLFEKCKKEKMEIHDFEFPEKPTPLSIYHLYQKIRSIQPDLIHAHLNQACFQTGISNLLLSCPHISTIHGFSTPLYYLFSDSLISVSKAIHESLPLFLKKKSTIIHNGIEAPEKVPKKIKPPTTGAVFATIHPNKGQEFLIQSLEKLTDFKILLIGSGTEKHCKDLQNLVLQSKNPVQWIKTMENLEPHWAEIDFLIVPSRKEALSYVAIEALARNIPVLASATGGLKEVIEPEKTGLLFETKNYLDLNLKMKEMIKRSTEFRQNLEAEEHLKRHPEFQIKTMGDKILDVYKKILNI